MKLNDCYKIVGAVPTDRGEVSLIVAAGKPSISQRGNSFCIEVRPSKKPDPIQGFTFPNSKILQIVNKAIEEDSDLILRFEKQRKKTIDPNIPIAELTTDMSTAKKNIFKSCVGVYDVNNKVWVLDGAHSDPSQDPEDVAKLIEYATRVEPEVDLDKFFSNTQVPPAQQVAPNPTSFDKQQCILTLYFWLIDCEKKYKYTLNEQARRELTLKLLRLTDELYYIFKDVDKSNHNPSYSSYTHTRARFALFRFEETISELNENAIKDINGWMKKCYQFYKDLAPWASGL